MTCVCYDYDMHNGILNILMENMKFIIEALMTVNYNKLVWKFVTVDRWSWAMKVDRLIDFLQWKLLLSMNFPIFFVLPLQLTLKSLDVGFNLRVSWLHEWNMKTASFHMTAHSSYTLQPNRKQNKKKWTYEILCT